MHTDQQLRELIANYYGMISLIDHNVGRIVLELEQLGLLENTLSSTPPTTATGSATTA